MSRPTDPSSSVAAPGPEGSSLAPHPGVASMPRWDSAELPDTPRFDRRLLAAFIGPALVMGASAVGGGEWLTGPRLTARYGAALFWLPTLSILFQTIYNIEISRYTLYSGEPIFTGKFRVPPGPWVWLFIYLLLDFGSLLPYLASNAAVPLFAMIFGRIPELNMSDVIVSADERMVTWLGVGVFLVVLFPLCVGGKIYNSMRAVMIFKLVVVFGFLLVLAAFFSSWDTWAEIGRGFVNFGALPVKTADGSPRVENVLVALWEGRSIPELDLTLLGFVAAMAAISGNGGLTNTPVSNYTRDQGWGMGGTSARFPASSADTKSRSRTSARSFRSTSSLSPAGGGGCGTSPANSG